MERRRTLAVLEQSLGERILSRVNHTSFAARGSQSQNFHVYFPSVEWPFPFAFPSRPAAEKIVPPIATVEFDSSTPADYREPSKRGERAGWMPSKLARQRGICDALLLLSLHPSTSFSLYLAPFTR